MLASWDDSVSFMCLFHLLSQQPPWHVSLFLLLFSVFLPLSVFLNISPSFPIFLFSSLPLIQNADKLYKGQLSEFTPLASLHAPSKAGSHRRGSGNQRNAPNPRRSEPFTKKIMFTRWQKTPDYCTFTPLLRFVDGAHHSRQGHAYSDAGPETSV